MTGSLKAGDTLGSYTLIKSLGYGGMAEVFLARHSGVGGFQRLVALKIIHPTHAQDTEFVESLVEEAKVAVQLSHPNVGQVFDLGLIDKVYFIVMEFIDGKDLHRLLYESSQQNQSIPIPIALYVAECVAAGLMYCHQRNDHYGRPMNLIHRDVSPQNIFISWNGDVKLLDFGIAKVSNRLRHTEAGIIKGKLQYMSPEQITGASVDGRSDLFSCGICLYEMLAGEMAYRDGDALELLEKIRTATLVPLNKLRDGIDPSIHGLVSKSLSVNPDERFQDGESFSTAVSAIRHRLYPDFRPSELGRYLSNVFDEAPFYLEESVGDNTQDGDDDLDLSVSMSSSIIFGDDQRPITSKESLPLVSEAAPRQESVNFDESGSQTALLDSVPPSENSTTMSSLSSGSMAEETNLFDVPASERATPFTDLPTNEGFAVQASPISGVAERKSASKDRPNDSDKSSSADSDASTRSENGVSQSMSTSQGPVSMGGPSSNGDRVDNPFDASAPTGETKRPVIVRKPFGWAEPIRKQVSQSRWLPSTLMGRLTALILLSLTVYLGFYALPYLFGDPRKPMPIIHIETEPPGAQVFIDSRLSEKKTNTDFTLPSIPSVSITVKLSGYEIEEFEVETKEALEQVDGEPIRKRMKLVPLD